MNRSPITIVLLDACEATRVGLRQIFCDSTVSIVGEASSPNQAVKEVALNKPDILLADPYNTGWDVGCMMSRMTSTRPDLKVVIFTERTNAAAVHSAIRGGAKAYLLKTTLRDQLLENVLRAYRGEFVISPALASEIASILIEPKHQRNLSNREIELLNHVSDGLTNRQIAHLMNVSEGTVKTYLKRAFMKLGVHNRSSAVRVLLEQQLNGN